jgi:hypothetical protein
MNVERTHPTHHTTASPLTTARRRTTPRRWAASRYNGSSIGLGRSALAEAARVFEAENDRSCGAVLRVLSGALR